MEVAVKQGYTMGLAEGFKLGQLKGTVMAALAQHAVQTINAGGGAAAAEGNDAKTAALQALVAKVTTLEGRIAETVHDPEVSAAVVAVAPSVPGAGGGGGGGSDTTINPAGSSTSGSAGAAGVDGVGAGHSGCAKDDCCQSAGRGSDVGQAPARDGCCEHGSDDCGASGGGGGGGGEGGRGGGSSEEPAHMSNASVGGGSAAAASTLAETVRGVGDAAADCGKGCACGAPPVSVPENSAGTTGTDESNDTPLANEKSSGGCIISAGGAGGACCGGSGEAGCNSKSSSSSNSSSGFDGSDSPFDAGGMSSVQSANSDVAASIAAIAAELAAVVH